MFWKASSFSSGNSIEAILDKQHITLEELLEEDELMQECKALNARLIAYLKSGDAVHKLVSFVIEPAKSWASERQQQRFPFIACEVLCCEIDGIFDTLVTNEELLSYFFSILEQQRPLVSTRAGYFARVLSSLLTKCSSPVMQFVQGQPWVLRKAVNHIETFSILESIQRMVGAADHSNANAPASDLQWLPQTTVLQHLLSKLNSETESDTKENAGKLLAHIGRSRVSPLTALLPQHLQPMLEKAFAAQQGSQLRQALHICIALLERRQAPQAQAGGRGEPLRQSVERAAAAGVELDSKLEADAVASICHHTPHLAALLDTSPPFTQLETTYGLLDPPLGSARLAVIGLIGSLLSTGSPVAEQAIVESDSLSRCLQLVVQYPFNSMLHHLVTDIITTALAAGPASLLHYLFQHCNLLHWLLTIPVSVTPKPRPGTDSEGVDRPPWRAGYMGHITQIGNILRITAESRREVAEHVQHSSQWHDYSAQELEPRNELQDLHRWSFGRPDPKALREKRDKASSEETPVEDLSNGLAVPELDANNDRYGAFDDYDEEDHILFQQNQGVDSDEEDERVGVGMSNRHDEGLTSFPVDSWEDTWDDSDAPVSQEAANGWGRLGSQLYQNHWDTQEHSGWSDDDEQDPDMLHPNQEADDCDAVGELDEDAVVVEDHSEAEDSDAVMVDALEALRLTQPHMAHASSTGYYAPHADENQRPQTATGSRHVSDDSSFANGGPADKWHHPSKGFSPSGRRSNNRMVPCGDGSMWAMFGRGRKDDSDCNGVTHEFGGNSTLVQLGLQSRLAEAAEDMHSFADEGGEGCQSQDTTFSSAQYWKTPLAIPQDIENA
ncbi:hypothetical protein ABBQ38_000230 [Trebouxia sp. C0009 RCD-2024]